MSNTLTVTGGNDQFVVVYKQQGPGDAGAGSTAYGGAAAGGQPFGAPGALNSTGSHGDYSALSSGQVYVVTGGQSDLVIDGSDKQFVVEYLLPPSASGTPDAGSNTVTVNGGNNAFVVAYEYASPDSAGAYGGNAVTVNGGDNTFVVSYNSAQPSTVNSGTYLGAAALPAQGDSAAVSSPNPVAVGGGNAAPPDLGMSDPTGRVAAVDGSPAPSRAETTGLAGNTVAIDGGNNEFVVSYAYPAAGGAGLYAGNTVTVNGGSNKLVVAYNAALPSAGSSADVGGIAPSVQNPLENNSGFIIGDPGPNAVKINGDRNQYVVNYSGVSNDGTNSGAASMTGNPFGGPSAGAPGGAQAGAPSGGDLASLLAQSPFNALLKLPGVTAENLFSNVNPADYAGGNPFAALGGSAMSGAYGGNPFAGLGSAYAGASPGSGSAYPGASAPSAYPGAGSTGSASAASAPMASALMASAPVSAPPASGAGGVQVSVMGSPPNSPTAFPGLGNPSSTSTSSSPASAAGQPAAGAAPSTGNLDPFGGVGGDPASFLAKTPFAPLLNLPGVTANSLIASLGSGGGAAFFGGGVSAVPAGSDPGASVASLADLANLARNTASYVAGLVSQNGAGGSSGAPTMSSASTTLPAAHSAPAAADMAASSGDPSAGTVSLADLSNLAQNTLSFVNGLVGQAAAGGFGGGPIGNGGAIPPAVAGFSAISASFAQGINAIQSEAYSAFSATVGAVTQNINSLANATGGGGFDLSALLSGGTSLPTGFGMTTSGTPLFQPVQS